MNEHNRNHLENDDDLVVINLSVLFCDLWKGFKKFWWVFLILCSVTAGINYTQRTVRYTPMYESKVSFTVSTQSGYDEANTSYGFFYNQSTAEQLEKLFPYILQSDIMQALIKEELGTDYINGSIRANAVSNSNLFTMKSVSGSSQDARRILEATLQHLPEVTKYIIGETKLNIIQPVTTPTTVYNKPNYRKEVVKGFLVGVALSCMLLAAYAVFRRTIRRENDFQSILNMKCLGVIPQVKFKAHNSKIDRRISVLNEKTGRSFREAMKSLNLKLDRRMKENNKKVLLVTSTLQGEGKSMTAMNLALTLSQRGKKVLLMDMDLRNPTQARNLQVKSESACLEKVLEGTVSGEEAVQKLSENLYFLGAYKPCKNVSYLLTKPTLGDLIQKYRDQMDYIILDTPPCGTISDAMTISNVCDGIFYVIRQDYAKQGQVLDAIQHVTSHGTSIIGGLLNGVEGSLSGYGYYGYGRYGYGRYGYGRYGYGRYGYGGYGYGKKSKKSENE